MDRPRFRNDLVAQPIEEEGVRYVDVTDPNSGSTFRFYDVEYSIACAMDGGRDVENLAEWTRAELGIEASRDELVSVINTLAELGYLEGHDAAAGSAQPPVEGEAAAVPETMDSATATEAQPSSYTDETPELPAVEGDASATVPETETEESVVEAEPEPPPPPVEDIELGPPGRSSEPAAGDTVEEPPVAAKEEPATPAAIDEAEVSFAGILEDEEPKDEVTPPPPRPAARPAKLAGPAHHLDDEDPTQVPTAGVDDDEDDVSVDLSAHLALDKNEVAEAVRSSRVHEVPELPRELTLEITDDDKVTEEVIPVAAAAPESAAARAPEPEAPPSASISSRPPPIPVVPAFPSFKDEPRMEREEPRPSTRPIADEPRVPPAVALPSRPPAPLSASQTGPRSRPSRPIEPTRMPPPATAKAAPQRSVSVGLILALIVLVGALLVYVFQDQILGSGEHSGTTRPPEPTPTPTAPKPVTPEQPPAMRPPDPPAAPTATVKSEDGAAATVEAKSPSAGTVAWIVADGSTVEQDAPIAKLFGFAKHEQTLREATARGEFYTHKLEEAQAKSDTAGADAAQRKIDEKKALVEESKKELDRYTIKAPVAGAVKLSVAQGATVKPDDVVASVGGPAAATMTASFTVGPAAEAYKAGDGCVLASKAAQDKQFPCVVSGVEAGKVNVRLVTVSGSATPAAGDEVVLLPATK